MSSAFLPMLASLSEPPVAQRGLVYEPKYDGIRAIVNIDAAKKKNPGFVSIVSRNGNDKTAQFPAIVKTLEAIAKRLKGPVVLDGEIVAIDKDGHPLGFQHIQGRIHLTSAADIARAERDQPAALIVFDLLRDGNEDLRGQPLVARRLRLQERIRPRAAETPWVRLSEIALDDGRELLTRARAEGWEGLIVKEAHSPYHSGKRSPAWRKMKLLKQQEFVVGGWTEPRQSRTHFGSLLVGYYDDDGKLRWAGAVGTGFDQKELDRVAALLRARETPHSPFDDKFKTAETPHWVKPTLVAEVRFTEWTSDGLLRQPVYLGTRDDKNAKDIRREDARQPDKPAVKGNVSYQRHHRIQVGSQKAEVRSTAKVKGQRSEVKGQVESQKSEVRSKAEVKGEVGRQKAEGRGKSEVKGQRSKVKGTAEVRGAKVGNTHAAAATVDAVVERLNELEDARKDGEVPLPNGDTLRVTNLAKVFWPELRITKGELLRYYAAVSPLLLPVVDDRPMVMRRFPNGVDKQAFYQQRHPEAPPAGVRREVLPPDIEPIDEDGPRDRLIGGSLTTLLYMAQLACISQDPWFSKVATLPAQDHAAIDLDPGDGAGFDKVLDVARWVKDEMDRLGVPGVPKTSGSRGLHIYIPLPKNTSYESGQLLCHFIANLVVTKHPKVATIERMVKKRPRATIYVDYLQNILGKTLATAYSVRATDYAGVSTPLTWKEVARGVDPRDFTIRTALARFKKAGDLWAEVRTGKPVNLPAVLARAAK